MDIHLKTCKPCGMTGGPELFKKDKHSVGGRRNLCKKCAGAISKATRLKKHDQYLANAKTWRQNNLKAHVALTKKWREANREHFNTVTKEWNATPLRRITNAVRARINSGLKAAILKKRQRSVKLLGIDFENYIQYLEAKFASGMSIHNHGQVWHIDHIVPLASAKSESELLALLHYTNTQPLFVKDNLSKGAKLDWRN